MSQFLPEDHAVIIALLAEWFEGVEHLVALQLGHVPEHDAALLEEEDLLGLLLALAARPADLVGHEQAARLELLRYGDLNNEIFKNSS